ncbi:MAG: TPM domain-containing protein [Chthoniobacterales bacterium]
MIRALAAVALLVFGAAEVGAAEKIPPKPAGYFNDYANVVPKAKALQLNEKLAQFERETSNQVVVAVYRKMESDSDVADYTRRIAEAWKIGQAEKRNGAALFVFVDDRKMFIQVGYGLEGALPDVTAFDITERHIKPRFRTGDYAGGLDEGVDLILQGIRGEYKGDGATVQDKSRSSASGCGPLGFVVMLIIILTIIRLGRRRGGFGYTGLGGPFVSSGWGSGWSGSSSSSSSGGGFSGFSGGGGSFGGGGAGSSW